MKIVIEGNVLRTGNTNKHQTLLKRLLSFHYNHPFYLLLSFVAVHGLCARGMKSRGDVATFHGREELNGHFEPVICEG